jgi:hypothetical protein
MKIINIFLISFVIFTYSCTERINVNVDDSFTRIVIEGSVNTDTCVQRIKITQTSNYFFNEPSPRIKNATVTISDGSKTFTLKESKIEAGIYETEPTFFGIIGKTYTLNVSDVDIDKDGKTEKYSAISTIPPVIGAIDSINVVYKDYGNPSWRGYQILVYAWDPPSTDFYCFKAYRNGHLVTDTISEWAISDDVIYNGNYTNGIEAQFLRDIKPDEKIEVGDTVTFELNAITEDYFKFIYEVQTETQGQNPLFSGPPSNIRSNISNGGLGYFTAYSTVRKTRIVTQRRPE